MKRILPVCLILCFVCSKARSADDEKTTSPWSSFPFGSWVILSDEMTEDGKTKTSRSKNVWIDPQKAEKAASPRALTFEIFEEKDGKIPGKKSRTQYTQLPTKIESEDDFKLSHQEAETLQIDGKAIECQVKQYSSDAKQEKWKVKFWIASKELAAARIVPVGFRQILLSGDIVKAEFEFESKDRTSNTSVVISKFAEPVKVAGKDIACVRQESSVDENEAKHKTNAKAITYLSSKVPGYLVKIEGEFSEDGKLVAKEKILLEDFFVPKK